jgi:hypothetical protein
MSTINQTKVHDLKTDPYIFNRIVDGDQNFEIRLNDRNFQVGDIIISRETRYSGVEMKAGRPLEYTGRLVRRRILAILDSCNGSYGLEQGWCILTTNQVLPGDVIGVKTILLHLS